MYKKAKTLWKILIIVLAVLLVPASLFVSVYRQNFANADYFTLWLGGRMVSLGQNPYVSTLWVNNHALYGSSWIENLTYVYPLYTAVFFYPLGLINLPFSAALWVWFCLIAILGSGILLVYSWNHPDWKKFLLPVLLSLIIFRPAVLTVFHGQIDGLLLVFLTVSILLWQKGKTIPSCISLALLILKPNIGFPILAFFAMWLLMKKEWRGLSAVCITVAVMILIALMINPAWISEYFRVGLVKSQDDILFPNLRGIAGLMCTGKSDCTNILWGSASLLLCLFAAVLLMGRANALDIDWVLALSLCATLLVTPYLRAYDLLLLVIPASVISKLLLKVGQGFRSVSGLWLGLSLASLGLLFLANQLRHDIWSSVLTLLLTATLLVIIPKSNAAGKLTRVD